MNRLVIIGNGFDLAHGLPTGYCDFIDWFWTKVIENIKLPINNHGQYNCEYEFVNIQFQFKADYYGLQYIREEFVDIKSFAQLNEIIQKYQISHAEKVLIEANPNRSIDNCRLTINNHFFKTINDKKQVQTWVDIENEYYKLLKNCLKEEDNEEVKKLNEEFEQVKKLLEMYLAEHIAEKYDFKKPNEKAEDILNLFKILPKYLPSQEGIMYLKEFPESDREDLMEYHTKLLVAADRLIHKIKQKTITPETNLFLNFNYTPTVDNYIKLIEGQGGLHGYCKHIQIHGRLNDHYNKINFGFGDEMDDHYKQIENKGDNEYLKNIKSFQYLQNSNYKDLLDFIDSEKFQVYIMGHSCGLSDRILLNTIFEHEHCRSIKVFYHEKDGKDNYTDIVQNISRHFNKKKTMRDKLVNKSLCQPLPQNIRFDEKK